jgi:hypothetical protein
MRALRAKCCGVTNSEPLTDHLLDDDGEVLTDAGAHSGREAGPDGGGLDRHSASQYRARLTSSVTASRVSFVGDAGRGGARLVAAVGSRKTIVPW